MVSKITITVPDDLHEILKNFKNDMNVSGVCQRAIAREIEIMELKKFDDEESIVKKLRMQKREHNEQYHQDGFKAGLEDAKTMDYSEIVGAIAIYDETDFTDGPTDWEPLMQCELYSKWLEDPIDRLKEDDRLFGEDEYLRGWLEGIVEFFTKIKDDL